MFINGTNEVVEVEENAVTGLPSDLDNILCVDVEDWYHPEYVRGKVIGNKEIRVNKNVDNIVQFLGKFDVKATFFVVGEIAERSPEMLNKIFKNGHEVAFHGYYHTPLWVLTPASFRAEIAKYNSLLRSTIGVDCMGFRAPSYSLDNRTKWALDELEKAGYVYDSSVFPIKTPLYGESSAPLTPYHPSSKNIADRDNNQKLIEFPALVYPVLGLKIPAAGGFYLRFFPAFIIKGAIKKMNKTGYPAVLSFHPWELDPETPRLKLGLTKSFVTYHNLAATGEKLADLISTFQFTSFKNYLGKHDLI